MPVDTPHPKYSKLAPKWKRCRDAFAGEDEVKAAGDVYLPKLSGQTEDEYNAYVLRAMFYSATGRTVRAMAGALTFRSPTIVFPENQDSLLESIGTEGESALELFKKACEEILVVGRGGMLVDAPPSMPGQADEPPYLAPYVAEAITNWSTSVQRGKKIVVRVVLKEERAIGGMDSFAQKTETIYRVLNLGIPMPFTEEERKLPIEVFLGNLGITTSDLQRLKDGLLYWQEIWEKVETGDQKLQWTLTQRFLPRKKGGMFWEEIPFVFFNPCSTLPDPDSPPVLDLVNVNLSHYRTSADLEHGRHFTALPTPWAAGWSLKEGQSLTIGSSQAWVTDEPTASAGYLEFSGTGLGHLQTGLEAKERLMAVLGARLLTEPKGGVESAEAIALRTGGERSALSDIGTAIEQGFSKALSLVADWMLIAEPDEAAYIEVNKDFMVATLSPALVASLMMAVQQGMLSWNSWFFVMKRSEFIPNGISEEDEAARILAGTPGAFNAGLGAATGVDEEGVPIEGEEGAAPEKKSLNGAQIAAARQVIADYVAKIITSDQAKELLLAVGIAEESIAKMLTKTTKPKAA